MGGPRGPRANLSLLAAADWADFETAISVSSAGPYFQVLAMDSEGRQIDSSEVVAA